MLWGVPMNTFSIPSLDSSLMHTETWPQVDEQSIAEMDVRRLYIRRCKAIRLLLDQSDDTHITSATGLPRREALRLLKRCLMINPDGQIFGFRALIPHSHIGSYTRHVTINFRPGQAQGGAGAFQHLLATYPVLASLLQAHVFKLSKRKHVYESRTVVKSLHKRFIDKCRELGLEKDCQYPFNTKTLAYVSLAKHVRQLLSNPDRAAAGSLGTEIAKKLRSEDGTARPLTKPFERVECDAHHIDAIFCILIPSIFGELIPKIVHRLWVLVIQDVTSKAILGYHLSLREECNAEDILMTIRNALTVWVPRTLSVPGMTYSSASGFPSSHDQRFIGACWDQFSVDGAMANLALRVADKLEHVVGATSIVLPRRIPNDRPFVERFFGILEESGFHRLPNTTGNAPDDPRRHHPEQAAVRYTLQVEQLEDLIDVLIANFNGTPHGSIGYRTPLHYLSYLCEAQSCWPRQADAGDVARVLNVFKTVAVRGGTETGRRPYIHCFGVNYSSDVLKFASHWVGQKISIEINVRDLRTVKAYAPDGAEIGVLRAAPPWHRTPHTLEMRQAVNALVSRKMLHYLEQSDPVMALLEHLESLAQKGKSVPPLYLEARRLLTENISALSGLPRDSSDHATELATISPMAVPLPPSRKTING